MSAKLSTSKQPTLYMMLGVPGAGKTLISEYIASLTGAKHINSDQFRQKLFGRVKLTTEEHSELYQKLDDLTENLLRAGNNVIYDANLNRRIHRNEKYKICKNVGARAVLIWVTTPRKLSKLRATKLASGDPERRPFGDMPSVMFERLCSQIEPPSEKEKSIEIDGSDVNQDTIRRILQIC